MKQTGRTKKAFALFLSLLLALSFAPLFSVVLTPQANAAVITNRNSTNYVPGHYYYYPAGTTFIKSIHVGFDKDKDTAQSNAINPDNPYLLGQDWLDGMGSNIFKKYHYIYIAYGTTTNINEVWGTYIRMKHSSGTPSTYNFMVNGQSVPFTLGSDVDFNHERGSGSDYIYLYKTNDPAYGLPITEFRSGEGNNDGAKWESGFLTAERDNSGEVSDFNRNAGGKYLWLHYGNYSVFTDVTTQINALSAAVTEANGISELDCTEETWAALQTAKSQAQTILNAYNNRYRCATYNATEIQNKTSALNAALNSLVQRAYNIHFNGAGNNGGQMTDQRLPVTAARNLNANGFSREFTVTYNYNGATGGNAIQQAQAVSQFSGWATSLYGPTVYADGQSVQGLTTVEDTTIQLYANWQDSSVTLPNPTKEGYTFVAWYSDPSFASTYRVGFGGNSYKPGADVTLYAKWAETTYNRLSFTHADDTNYQIKTEPAASTTHSQGLYVKLQLVLTAKGCEPVLTCNTGTVTMRSHTENSLIREYDITGVSADYSIDIGPAVPPTYTVTFVNSLDGSTISTVSNLTFGDPVAAPELGEGAGKVEEYVDYTDGQHLKFTGWDTAYTPVTGNTTVSTVYEPETHNWDNGTVLTQNAICDQPVDVEYHCGSCGKTKIETSPAGNHTFTRTETTLEGALKSAATCQSPAVYYYSCANCDTVEGDDNHTFTSGQPIAHSYTAQTVKPEAKKSDATCTDAAVYYYSCAGCGAVEGIASHTFTVGEANGHNYEWIVDKNSNCGETGLKHEECSVCHVKRSEGTVIPTQGEHQFTWIEDKAPTCVATGLKHEECSVCHAKRNENSVINATGEHNLSRTAPVAVTCTTDGNIEYWTCSVCRQKFSDAAGQNTVTDVAILHQGHIFTAERAEAEYRKSAATCTAAAVYYKSCANCGAKGTETFSYGDPLPHDFYWVTDTAATCVDAGVKHEKCRNCTATRNLNTRIDPTGIHNYTMQTVKAEAKKSDATCTAPAVYYYSCSVCGGVEGNANHTFNNGSALGHAFGEWVTDRAPTCTQEGAKHRDCGRCGYVDRGTIAKTSHVDNNGDYACDECGADVTPANVCPYCHKVHGGGFDAIIGFFHRIIYFFQNLFG